MMVPTPESSIRKNLLQVSEQIEQAARSAGREPESIRLIVVTKGHPVESIQAAVQAGARRLGENYVDEALTKMDALGEPPRLEWHMIGHVQSRKALSVSQRFDWLHSLDSLKLAQRLDRFAGGIGRRLPVLLECNTSGEETKFGWPAWLETSFPVLAQEFQEITMLPNLEVRGLMTMAPFFDEPEPSRPCFHRLRRLRDYLARQLPETDWQDLSMGMSGDFGVAIQEGATLVRIGTAIMGARP